MKLKPTHWIVGVALAAAFIALMRAPSRPPQPETWHDATWRAATEDGDTVSIVVEDGTVTAVSFDVALRDEPGRASQEWPTNVPVEHDDIHAFFASGTTEESWSIYLERKVEDDTLPGTITIVHHLCPEATTITPVSFVARRVE